MGEERRVCCLVDTNLIRAAVYERHKDHNKALKFINKNRGFLGR